MTYPFGIDISKYQDPAMINYDKIAEQVDFVILRIGFGWTKDIYFERHYLAFTERGVRIGGYHFPLNTRLQEQADLVKQALDGKRIEAGLWVDVEAQYQSRSEINAYIPILESTLDTEIGIYTSYSKWLEVMQNETRWASRRLWVANYYVTVPRLPSPWKKWCVWQYSSTGRLNGYAGNLDLDWADADGLSSIPAIGEETPEPEPPVEVEDKLFDAKVTTTPPNRLKTRYTPNGAERPKADWLQSQAVVPVYETHSTGWWRVAPEAWSSATWMERVEDKLPEPQEPLFQARVYSWATPYVNVRAEPSLSAGKVGFKYPLAVTDVMSTVPDWYEVPEGWMMSRFLERLDYDPPAILLDIKPLWQNDPRWKDHKLGNSYYTIGQMGCLITALSGQFNTTPDQLNDALLKVGGFTGANLYWKAITTVMPNYEYVTAIDCYYVPAPLHEIDALLEQRVPPVVQVDLYPGGVMNQHWVQIVGKSGSDYIINDPINGKQVSFRQTYGDPARWIFRIRAYRRQA
ncbi:MAG: GH25 family lysozyme [Bacteroidales bacterium]|jgi:GH25 family lysozyme M1 (1,4-beta-N-acetylmuramidase)